MRCHSSMEVLVDLRDISEYNAYKSDVLAVRLPVKQV